MFMYLHEVVKSALCPVSNGVNDCTLNQNQARVWSWLSGWYEQNVRQKDVLLCEVKA